MFAMGIRAGRRPVAAGVGIAIWFFLAHPVAAQSNSQGGTGSVPPVVGGASGSASGSTNGSGGSVNGGASGSANGNGSTAAGSAATDLTTKIAPFVQLAGDIADALGLTFDSDVAVLRFFSFVMMFFNWLEMLDGGMPTGSE